MQPNQQTNETDLKTEQSIDKLREAAIYWQNQAVEAHKEILRLRTPVSSEQIEKLIGITPQKNG